MNYTGIDLKGLEIVNNHLSKDEINETRAGWETYFKVLANPMKGKVTRWFNEDVSTADTISIADFSEK